jgi:hypothetical protein
VAANVLNIHETVDPQPMRLEPFESFWNYEEIVFCPLQFFSTSARIYQFQHVRSVEAVIMALF